MNTLVFRRTAFWPWALYGKMTRSGNAYGLITMHDAVRWTKDMEAYDPRSMLIAVPGLWKRRVRRTV